MLGLFFSALLSINAYGKRFSVVFECEIASLHAVYDYYAVTHSMLTNHCEYLFIVLMELLIF